ncbi:MAG: glycosyltransferase family 2 protein [Deltaproteobacteria bacterium]|nr:glycosyltransferase family 2 protein [Deltaproteobacteria bacterium]
MIMKQIADPLHVSLVVAMYNEHNRIHPKSSGNPNGEDFIRRKMKQMVWLCDHSPVRFDMILVDDGCPNGSGAIAEKIVRAEGFDNARVLFIDNGINSRSPVLQGLQSSSDSRKGGAIQYGMWRVVEDDPARDRPHIVVYTDADMAAPVNQIGLLLKLQDDHTMVSTGSRYDTGSVCRGPWGKNGDVQGLTEFDRRMVGLRGVLFSKLFPQTGKITDTQCGLKAFNAEVLRKILLKTGERTFSFDIELLVLAAAAGTQIAFAPIYWHDSLAESNFWKQAT